MTTIKQILSAKAAGDDSDYKNQLHRALATAEFLDEAERQVARLTAEFRKASDTVTKLTGLELWHSDHEGGNVFFWKKPDPVEGWKIGKFHPTRAAAIRALLDDKIEWR